MKRIVLVVIALLSVIVSVTPALAQEGAQAQIAAPGYGGSCAQYHIVSRGETLARIARMYGTSWSYLASLNGITNPNRIYPGQYLCVAVAPPPPTTYVVQRGDRLSRIAQRFGVPMYDIVVANNIYNPNLIYPGQVLIIPQPGIYAAGGGQMMMDNQPVPVYGNEADVIVVPAPMVTPETAG
jgi:LysM repeat protein